MSEEQTNKELLLLAQRLETKGTKRSPEMNHLAQQLDHMKKVFQALPDERLSQNAKERLYAVLQQAFELRFSPQAAQQKQENFVQLYEMLKNFSQSNLDSIIEFWKNWASQEQLETTEREFVATLQFSARLASECSQEEFLGALIHEEMPPISLSDAELDCLNGGIKRASFERVFSPQFLSQAFKNKF